MSSTSLRSDAPPPDDDLDDVMDDADDERVGERESGIDLGFDAEEAAPASVRQGAAVIRRHWATLPMGPGVYRMLGADGEVLYVGKAKSLKKRVASYTRAAGHSRRIAQMISLTTAMVFVSTATETEALLLEANYIKQMKPRFNVVMRDDKSFPYILVTADPKAPQITKHRGARNRKGDYFGPFASVWAVNRTLNALQRAFLLRSCSDSYYDNRTRPCLLFQIKRCSGPCTGEVTSEGYRELVDEARDFLAGKSRAVKDRLAAEMLQAADAMEFERAARLRDRVAALSAVQGQQGINPKSVAEADVFAVVDEAGQFAIEVFFFRTYQNWGNRTYYPRADRSLASGEVLDSFLVQFYADKPPPRLVLLSHEVENRALLAEALTERAGFAVEVAVPQRGEKRDLVEGAAANGRQALARKLAETASQEKLLAGLGAAFGMDRTPRRVEVYDNSHIMGTNAVGAMIVAGPSGFMKTQYRTFNMKDVTPGDDFGMMRQMLRRRFARLLRESRGASADDALMAAALEDEAPSADGVDDAVAAGSDGSETVDMPFEAEGPMAAGSDPDDPAMQVDEAPSLDFDDGSPWPDLLLIDGGKGQLAAVREIMAELGVPVLFGPGAVPNGLAVVGIAKGPDRDAGRETFFAAGREPFKLHERDPALYFVQRLRDEAHRFAIGTHRAKRKKDITRSPLDEVAGIGPARKRALLHAFGTAKAIGRASLSDLEKVPGVNAATAKRVYDFFNEGGT
ncbi:excinuclease ABC subunit UvrC [Lichenibacterium ramalinae]|uniref:UvrABC system protein C n=1 Tax=Lichenibacterium ramalinae TaxID=2316527 RepID=A0A4Q2RKC7_9HYPH|nr:excinuclease ABC subunit UvrC [Lichenibacterium ramalinae]RYB07733.1 excinuclease ABC subunit UvrC [Lichenibacterium ramalinae]